MDINLLNYLKNNHKSLEDLSIIDSDIEKNEVFLTGENHGIEGNIKLKMEFLRYFKEKTNFKYYLCELPLSVTGFLNMYLETGDESILKYVYAALKGTDAYNKDEYDHWKYIYEFNKKLDIEDRIIPIGIDIEHQPKNAFNFIEHLLNKKDIPKEFYDYIKSYKNKEDYSNEQLKDIHEYINEELVNNKDLYKGLLKENYYIIAFISRNIANMVDVYSSNNFNGVRDKRIYENFVKLYKSLPKAKFFGQIGLSHIFQRSFPDIKWFGAGLNEDENFKGKVLSIAYAYKNSRYLYPTDRRNYIGNIDTLEKAIKEFDSFLNEKYTIFKLNGKESPFKENLIWPLSHKSPEGGVTTDYFQYLVVIKDSEAMRAISS